MDTIVENIYAVVTTRNNGSASMHWSTVEKNAVMRVEEESVKPDTVSVKLIVFDAGDLILGALDDQLNGEYPVPDEDLNVLIHYER